ncbi:hypothetical protein BGI30_06480 [Snodgrassella alvi]|nr:hypothetical protein BGI30_06480 [Snodgrassella alvi]PIT60322.1 hypothetical protein BHC59_00340 [Snodgrassella alvi]
MRQELVSYLCALADKNYQYMSWVKNDRPNGGHDELDYTIHFLYDDTDLAENPESMIGWILTSQEEAEMISNVIRALDTLFEIYGTELTDKEYLEKNEWNDVVDAAKKAKLLFNQ